jgi:uncharacterized protein YggT (Ycf19 family)
MSERNLLREDDERRVADYEAVKRKVDDEVRAELEAESERADRGERVAVRGVASELKSKALSEVAESEREVGRSRLLARVYQFVDYLFFLVYGLVGLMIGLELLGAREWTGFMRFMTLITTPLLAPFRSVMPDPAIGSFQLMLSYVLALVVYFLLHRAVKGLFRLLVHRGQADL